MIELNKKDEQNTDPITVDIRRSRDAGMPTVSANQSPYAASVRSEGEMPSADTPANPYSERPKTDPRKISLGSGTVSLACSRLKTGIIMGVLSICLFPLVRTVIIFIKKDIIGHNYIFFNNMTEILIDIAIIVAAVIVNIVLCGEKYHWEATGREFCVTRKNRPATTIFYEKVREVEYEPYKFLKLFNKGWVVKIYTFDGEYEFRYVFPFGKKQPYDYTPFFRIDVIVNGLRSGLSIEEIIEKGLFRQYDTRSLEEAFSELMSYEQAKQYEGSRYGRCGRR